MALPRKLVALAAGTLLCLGIEVAQLSSDIFLSLVVTISLPMADRIVSPPKVVDKIRLSSKQRCEVHAVEPALLPLRMIRHYFLHTVL